MFTRALTRRYPALANRNFRLLLADRLLAPLAFSFSLVGVSFAVLAATTSAAHPAGSTADLSYVLAAQIAPSLIFMLIGGVIADRIAPQLVIVAANIMIAVGEGTFGLLVLLGRPGMPTMLGLEFLTGTGMALFYPASAALLPRLVPNGQLQEASAISRLAMNVAMMGGAALAGECVALFGPGWALTVCGVGMFSAVPLMLAVRLGPSDASASEAEEPAPAPSMLRELREGWSEFWSHKWLWVTVLQFTVVLAAWYGGFQVLGPAVARAHLGGAQAWGLITAAEGVGLIVGGVVALKWAPRRPIVFVVFGGAVIALSLLSLAMLLPLAVICLIAFGIGVTMEAMMVVWTVTMAVNIPSEMLARVSAYDALGSVMGMPAGALIAGPIAAAVGASATQYGAAAIILVASALALLPREIRVMRWKAAKPELAETGLVEAELVEAELVETELVEAELVETELVETGLVEAELVEAELVEAEPAAGEPAAAESAAAEPSLPVRLEDLATADA
ncbi:MAG TPA: MFS transporter [Streptosporangiaceae bacterium]|nr:MFS transporter [Streptosporangiaceae bacterium]